MNLIASHCLIPCMSYPTVFYCVSLLASRSYPSLTHIVAHHITGCGCTSLCWGKRWTVAAHGNVESNSLSLCPVDEHSWVMNPCMWPFKMKGIRSMNLVLDICRAQSVLVVAPTYITCASTYICIDVPIWCYWCLHTYVYTCIHAYVHTHTYVVHASVYNLVYATSRCTGV